MIRFFSSRLNMPQRLRKKVSKSSSRTPNSSSLIKWDFIQRSMSLFSAANFFIYWDGALAWISRLFRKSSTIVIFAMWLMRYSSSPFFSRNARGKKWW